MPITIYNEFTNYANFALAASLSIALGLVTWAVLFAARARRVGARPTGATRRHAADATAPAPLLFAVTLAVSVFMIAPIRLSVLAGLVKNYSIGVKSGLTLRWLGEVWETLRRAPSARRSASASAASRDARARRALRLHAGAQPLARRARASRRC